jgi:hypothetical protein
VTERENREHREEAERERATSEDRATPLRSAGTPFHGRDTADALHPENPLDPPPDQPEARHDPDEEGEPTEGDPA